MTNQKYYGGTIVTDRNGKSIKALTKGQHELIKAIDEYDILFVNGPAGWGKTFLALAQGIRYLQDGKYNQVSLTRPLVESGEELGFLPGTLEDKMAPYMKPLYDNLYKIIDKKDLSEETVKTGKKKKNEDDDELNWWNKIEVAPLAYIRGATLDNSFVIMDEAQNVTISQMKLFLTRMGKGSKMILAGDMTQTDLSSIHDSGFKHAQELLHDVDGIGIITMNDSDIVRHKLVRDIIKKYETANSYRLNTYTNHDRYDDDDDDDSGVSYE
jgi:phosphate starvation-inducible PhoH-like protein